MNLKRNISFISGDTRQIYLANLFAKNLWHVYTYDIDSPVLDKTCIKCISIESALNHSDIVVFPFKIELIDNNILSKLSNLLENKIIFAGNIPFYLTNSFSEKNIKYYDFFKVDYVTRLNAIATAEGCIMEAIKSSKFNLHNNHSLVIGYGNCAQVLANKLKNLDSLVTITCRNSYQGACAISAGMKYLPLKQLTKHIHEYLFIFNTVPAKILSKKVLDNTNIDAFIIDIAPLNCGIDLEYAKMMNLNAVNIPGIPGKVSPISSAYILYDYILNVLSSYL